MQLQTHHFKHLRPTEKDSFDLFADALITVMSGGRIGSP
jgi:hypothetical protein